MSVLVEFAMFPTDKGESVSSYVSRIIKVIDESGFEYKLTPMGTVFETETMEEALGLINKAYSVLEPDCNRIYSTIKFDIRKNRSNRLTQKIASIESKLGKKVKQ
ncbi:MTH1187 family thiamine-binding protein [Hippea sp. KM1]|uniref:MTH1187 family thiamine-binding protein n=1 Tax=Hippea sp. KM1 TaxID=944481 RepID=UPI00046D44D4|nr:MTH1187 family thiamine-binding protein [Hippea sp. KM1]